MAEDLWHKCFYCCCGDYYCCGYKEKAKRSITSIQQTFHQQMYGVQERKRHVRVFHFVSSFFSAALMCVECAGEVLVGTDKLLVSSTEIYKDTPTVPVVLHLISV